MTVATRPLGRTGRVVSELGFGCGGFWGRRWMDETAAIALVHQAIQLGITVFDTAHSYGDGLAEERLGRALRKLGAARDRLMISTKVGTVRQGRWGRAKDFSPDTIEAQVVDSLDRLGLERIPLLYLHGPEPAHLSDDLLDTLAAIKGDGVIGLLGINGVPHQIEAALATGLFDVVMPVYNPVDRRSATVIDQAAAAGLGVMAAAPLARMAFAPRDGDWTTPAGWWTAARRFRDRWLSNRTAAGAHKLHFLSEIEQWTAAQASLGVVLSNSNVHCAVFATTNPAHLKSNVAASGRPLPSAIQIRLDAL